MLDCLCIITRTEPFSAEAVSEQVLFAQTRLQASVAVFDALTPPNLYYKLLAGDIDI